MSDCPKIVERLHAYWRAEGGIVKTMSQIAGYFVKIKEYGFTHTSNLPKTDRRQFARTP